MKLLLGDDVQRAGSLLFLLLISDLFVFPSRPSIYIYALKRQKMQFTISQSQWQCLQFACFVRQWLNMNIFSLPLYTV